MNDMAWQSLKDKFWLAVECLIADLGYGAWRNPDCNACKVCIAARYAILAAVIVGLWMFNHVLTVVAVVAWFVWALWTGEAAVLPEYLTTKFRAAVAKLWNKG